MVTSWILNSLSKKIADSIEYVNDAMELWIELEDRYEQTNGARLYQIQKEINDTSQGTLDITSYYTKLKKLWEELSTLSKKSQCTCNCTCGAKENIYKAEQDRRLIQFLMGLNETYTVIRGSILMINPLPNLAQAFSLLIQDEKQREIKPHTQLFVESTSMNVTNSRSSGYRTNYSPNNNNHAGQGRGRPMCDYCKKPGHTKDKCFKPHGYPENFGYLRNQNYNPNQQFNQNQGFNRNQNFNKGKRIVANVHGDHSSEMLSTKGEEQSDLNTDQNISLSKEHYGQILNLLQHFQSGNGGDNATVNNSINGAVNFAGPFNEEASGDW
ncbi:PREDICTED: uncharacterized protein LOC109218916 [Nicotiana attenuata]|uniref:uncharacterized protein LOC109218916 n=1 Tax=Nicotiana attenuata TaxID=49451 RepID=UPI000905CA73|nr:PREDICTED: uncharacterized protein LOC109218916 [Nicotiana attenuata]